MIIQNRPELYKQTVDDLYAAYFAGELKHDDCMACGVGTICARASVRTRVEQDKWKYIFFTNRAGKQVFDTWLKLGDLGTCLHKLAFTLIDATGYNPNELAALEHKFETAHKGSSDEDWMFNGLEAMLEHLKIIHEVIEDEETLPKFEAHYFSLVGAE